MTVDPKCWELAERFLLDSQAKGSPENIMRVAEAIQRTIEDELQDLERGL